MHVHYTLTLRIVLLVDANILTKNNEHIWMNMFRKDRCLIVLIHRVFHNNEGTQRMPGKYSPDHNVPVSILDRSINGCRVIDFRFYAIYANDHLSDGT
ncbi:hypothetical protein TNCV_5020541 [Trichonephila clavipes]|nr:hypothetical protein TNCV_5020541 [Trichonephila clavipes]